MRRHGHLTRSVLFTADVIAAAAACVAAYAIRFQTAWIPIEGRTDVLPARYLEALPFAVLALVISASATGAHGREALARPTSVGTAVRAGTLGALLLAALALLSRDLFQYSRLTVAFAAALFVPAFVLMRWAAGHALARLRGTRALRTRAALVGGGAPALQLQRALAATPWTTSHVTHALTVGDTAPAWNGVEQIPDLAALRNLAGAGLIDEVYLALPATETGRLAGVLAALEQTTIDVHLVPDLGSAVLVNPGATVIGGLPVVSLRERPLYGLRAALKRLLDALLATLLLLLSAPLLLVIAIAVRCSSRGPALYRQTRMGLDGQPFGLLKFRTMQLDAETESGAVFTTRDDPRVTSLGRFLRRFSLDELPQLWNVVRGEMSLVGPRPERPEFIEEFRNRLSGYDLRHSVKAGMTGWAQVHGLRGESSLEDRLRYDLEYIDRWSLLFDIEILGRTAVHVVIGKNAY